MKFDQNYLVDVVAGKSRGDIPPFSSGEWKRSDNYLKQIVGRINDIKTIIVEADFNHYGSGFSSYVPLYLSKKDKSDLKIIDYNGLRHENTSGLMIYLCRLAPYAVYAAGEWSKTYKDDNWHSGSSHYIESENIGTTPQIDWNEELTQIRNILNQYGLSFLTKEELNINLDFEIVIRTILADPPYKIFDCLFYWED